MALATTPSRARAERSRAERRRGPAVCEAAQRGAGLGLSDDEVAYYDALEVDDSAVKVLGDETLRLSDRELIVVGERPILTG